MFVFHLVIRLSKAKAVSKGKDPKTLLLVGSDYGGNGCAVDNVASGSVRVILNISDKTLKILTLEQKCLYQNVEESLLNNKCLYVPLEISLFQ